MKHTREQVYAAIDSERAYQDAGSGNAARHESEVPRNQMHPAEFLTYMRKCLRDAEEACYRGTTGNTECLPFVRKIAGLAVACMEIHGAPPRA